MKEELSIASNKIKTLEYRINEKNNTITEL